MTERFDAYCRRREQAALAATIPGYVTHEDAQPPDMIGIANDWSRALFDGEFYRSALPSTPGTPVTNLVFVQSRDGNTAAPDPSTLGGGDTDLHLIYEGLSRVDADAVFAGASTARAKDIVFSIWHPQLVALRRARGRTRHPAQVVVTNGPNLRFEDALMFEEPELRVFVIASTNAAGPIRDRIAAKPWIDVIDAGEPVSFERAFRELRQRDIEVLSCVGGRQTATALLQERLVSDIYLTTSAIAAGEPNTPYYDGPPLPLERVVLKEGQRQERGVRFEHFRVRV